MSNGVHRRTATRCVVFLLAVVLVAADRRPQAADDAAWRQAAGWKTGDDVGPLLVVEKHGIMSRSDPAASAGHAARLAAIVSDATATPDARFWACLQLRFAGTAAEVPLLADVMTAPDRSLVPDDRLSDAARQALEGIAHPAAAAALRKALSATTGTVQAGIAAGLGRRRDGESVPLLVPLAASSDPLVSTAAVRALANIGDARSVAALDRLADAAGPRTPPAVAAAVLLSAERFSAAAGSTGDVPAAIRRRLAEPGQSPATRQAACAAQLAASEPSTRRVMLLDWIAGGDDDRMLVACGRLSELDDAALERLLASATALPASARLAVVTASAGRRSPRMSSHLVACLQDPSAEVRIAAIGGLAVAASAETVPAILAAARSDKADGVREAARNAVVTLPRTLVNDEVVAVLASGPTATADLVRLGGPAAWNALSRLASAEDASTAASAVAALEQVAEPSRDGLTKFAAIYAMGRDDAHRDAVARAIARLAARVRPEAGCDPAATVIDEVDRVKLPESMVLPLAGRLGGSRSLARIDAGLASSDAAVRGAAAEGLCNWPTPDVADRLASMATEGLSHPSTREAGRRAIRAHVRVISLPSDRPAEEVLGRLQAAMRIAAAGNPEDRSFVLERTAAAVRTMPAVEWIAGHLDREGLSAVERDAACRAIVALAHHRGLRQPNAERFDAILDRVAATTDDPALADQARRYKAGL